MKTARAFVGLLKLLLPIVVLAGAGFAAYTMIINRPQVVTQPPVIAPPGVRVHEVALEPVQVSVSSQGTVRPRTESQLVPEISGRVTWVAPSFAEGGFFEAGDVLVKIDPFDYQQALTSSRSQLAQARLRLAQEEAEAEVAQREWEELGRGDPRELTMRKPQLEDARAAVAAAEANVERARRDLQRAEVTAPYAGRIRRKNVDVGQFVTVGTQVATVYAVDAAEIRLPLPDEELAYLDLPLSYRGTEERPGPRVTLRATFAGKTHAWQGRVVRTESELDPATRMVHAVAEVRDPYAPGPDPDRPPLAVGMYVEAEIEGRRFADVAIVPRAALQGRSQVLVVDVEDRLHFRDVDVLRSTTESIYVGGGLETGELVIVSAIDGPTEGMSVQLADVDPDVLARRRGTTEAPMSAPVAEPQAAVAAEPEPAAAPIAAPSIPEGERPAWLESLLAQGELPAPARAARTPAPRPPVAPAPSGPVARDEGPAAVLAPRPTEPAPAPARPTPSANAVAVLPFSNISREPADAAIGTAIADAVSTQLSTITSLTVVRREAGASWIVGGGVQRIGNVIRITARVVDADSGAVLRAIKVDGPMAELSRLQNEVASQVTESMREAVDEVAGNDAA